MSEPTQQPTQQPALLDILNGEAGGDMQFQAVKSTVEQQIDAAFGMFRVLGAGAVGGLSSSTKQFLFLK
jgi:hypothetical protein